MSIISVTIIIVYSFLALFRWMLYKMLYKNVSGGQLIDVKTTI